MHWGTCSGRSSSRHRESVSAESESSDMQNIDREHPDYVSKREMWKRYRDLYVGGDKFQQNASEYLVRRHKEPAEIYGERLSRAFYENYVGSIIDWYAAT